MGSPTAWSYYDSFLVEKNDGTMDLNSDSMKVALFLSTSNCATLALGTYAALTNEHAGANGYTVTGNAVTPTITGSSQSVKFNASDPATWTANGGSIVARFAVLYNTTTGTLIGYSLLDDAPDDVTATDGNTFDVAFHTSGIFNESPA